MKQTIKSLRVVAEIVNEDGTVAFVDCAVRTGKDIKQEVVNYLLERALPEFQASSIGDALGG